MKTYKLLEIIWLIFGFLGSWLRSQNSLALENLALRQQLATFKLKHPRPRISCLDRGFWVLLRRIWSKWINVLINVNPETVVKWHRQGFKLYWKTISRRGKRKGRPRVSIEIRELIRRIALENLSWRAPRIHGELLKLGFDVSERTISRYLPRRDPDQDKAANWKAFLVNHKDGIAAMDFFTVPTVLFRQLYGFFIITHKRRKIIHFATTFNPTAEWLAQQLRNAFPDDTAPKYLIFDRDSIFSGLVLSTVNSFDIKPVRTSYRSPWQNGIAERWVGSCRRELLDHVIVFGELHLYRLLKSYVSYYNEDRCHYSLCKDAPEHRPFQKRSENTPKVISLPRVGGLHHRYEWRHVA
jgi:transposase InsO family protein